MKIRRHSHTGGIILALVMLCVAALPAAGQDNFGRGRGRAGSERMPGMRNFVGGLNLAHGIRTGWPAPRDSLLARRNADVPVSDRGPARQPKQQRRLFGQAPVR